MKTTPNISSRFFKKIFGSLLVVFFSLSLLAVPAQAGGCSNAPGCAACCLPSQQAYAGARTGPMPHGCPGGSCDFENNRVPDGLPNTITALSTDNPKVAGAAFGTTTGFSIDRIPKHLIPGPAFTQPAASPPIYLLNRSLLC